MKHKTIAVLIGMAVVLAAVSIVSVFELVQIASLSRQVNNVQRTVTQMNDQIRQIKVQKEKLASQKARSAAERAEKAAAKTAQQQADSQQAAAAPVNVQPVVPKGKVAYLTFDDGPSNMTGELLNTLDSCGVRATFFVVGVNAQQYPDTLKRMAAEGHAIGVHSWTHKYSYIYANTANFTADFNRLRDYIHQVTGITPAICRLPGGTNNTVCFNYNKQHIMRQIVPLVENEGFKIYDWNVCAEEVATHGPSKTAIVSNVLRQCQNFSKPVILFHDFDAQHAYVQAIPEIVNGLRSSGYSFDTLSASSPSLMFNPS